MVDKLYAFYDEGAKFFGPPVMAANINMIRRSLLEMEKQNAPMPFLMYPNDFVVYEIGVYDQDSGMLEATAPPVRIAVVKDLLSDQAQVVP